MSGSWDETHDLVVVGSGAGGMTTALAGHDAGCDTVVLERGEHFGGTSSMSGGSVWIPANPLIGDADDAHDAWRYLRAATRGEVAEDRLRAYLEAGPEMVRWLETRTEVRFDALEKYPDYYPELPGSRPGGRTIEALPYPVRHLGREVARLHPPHPQELMMGKMAVSAREAQRMLTGTLRGRLTALRVMLVYWLRFVGRIRFGRDPRLALGNALVGRLRRSLLDREVPVRYGARATRLVVEDGSVVGLETDSQRIRARRGVVLSAGGFARNVAMREEHQPAPIGDRWTAAAALDEGDAIRMGWEAGAALELMDEAWWAPTTVVPGHPHPYVLVAEKALPGSILVDGNGRRFTNEAAPYLDVVKRMLRGHREGRPTIPAYLVMDSGHRRSYPCGPLMPRFLEPDRTWSEAVERWIHRADTLRGVAEKMGIDAEGLERTVAEFDRHAAEGRDPAFGRGDNVYDRYYGDPRVRPNPNLRPLSEAPYYAIEVWPGDLGTKGGLVTDARARVLRADGTVIGGLYATGNCAASVMGRSYPGAGATLGPAMVFGYVAAQDAAGREAAGG